MNSNVTYMSISAAIRETNGAFEKAVESAVSCWAKSSTQEEIHESMFDYTTCHHPGLMSKAA